MVVTKKSVWVADKPLTMKAWRKTLGHGPEDFIVPPNLDPSIKGRRLGGEDIPAVSRKVR
jgi:hypothetical protein